MQLLIVPLALAVIGFVFTIQQDMRQYDIEKNAPIKRKRSRINAPKRNKS
jgi:hypothetical protein